MIGYVKINRRQINHNYIYWTSNSLIISLINTLDTCEVITTHKLLYIRLKSKNIEKDDNILKIGISYYQYQFAIARESFIEGLKYVYPRELFAKRPIDCVPNIPYDDKMFKKYFKVMIYLIKTNKIKIFRREIQ